MIPDNVDCNRKEIKHCNYFLVPTCPETCGYAEHIMGLGVKDSYQRRLEERSNSQNDHNKKHL